MKKYPSVNFAFTLSLAVIAILSLNPSARAQKKKEIKQTIIINNGDTTINGKKLSEVSKAEHKRLLEEFREMETDLKNPEVMFNKDGDANRVIIKRKKGKDKDTEVIMSHKGKGPAILHWKDLDDAKRMEFRFDDKNPGMHTFRFNGDSLPAFDIDTLMNGFSFNMDEPDSSMHKRIRGVNKNFRLEIPEGRGGHPRLFADGMEFQGFGDNEHTNSQSFNYTNTDKDGITSRMHIRISEANTEMLKKINGTESSTASLEVTGLTLFPNFSTGKITLSFNLDKRGTTDIKILDSDLKPVFTDKPANFSGNYNKQVMLPKNGVYYINISQNGNVFVRKMVKQ